MKNSNNVMEVNQVKLPKEFRNLSRDEVVDILNDYTHPWFDDLLGWALVVGVAKQ